MAKDLFSCFGCDHFIADYEMSSCSKGKKIVKDECKFYKSSWIDKYIREAQEKK